MWAEPDRKKSGLHLWCLQLAYYTLWISSMRGGGGVPTASLLLPPPPHVLSTFPLQLLLRRLVFFNVFPLQHALRNVMHLGLLNECKKKGFAWSQGKSVNATLSAGEGGRGDVWWERMGRHLVFSETELYDLVPGLPKANTAGSKILGHFIGGIWDM